MKLQTKLTLAFAAVALAPIAVLAGVARVVVANQYRAEFRTTLEQAEANVEHEYQRVGDEVADAVQRMARPDDPTLGPLLVALSRGALDEDRRGELEARAETAMRALGFDVLEILDERGEILAAPHFSGRVGDQDPAALALARRSAGHAQLVEDQRIERSTEKANESVAKPVLALEAAREAEGSFGGQRARVTVIGGRVLGKEFVERLHRGARLVSADGKLLFGPPAPAGGGPQTVVEFKRADGTQAARVELAISDAELRRTLELISLLAGGLAAGGVILALLLGAMVARRWSVPLGELSDGARAVARGDLAVAVPVRGRDEIGQLGSAFNAMIRDLTTAREELVRAERVAAWKEIAQRIAHEIKNPLTPIQMAIETLQRAHEKSPDQFDALFAESAKTILDEVARLKNIVGEFSAFARMPAPHLAPCQLGEVVDATLALYAAQPIERALAPGLPPVMADRDQLTQVLINLVENARDAAGPEGKIQVATRTADGRVELEVTDSGPGLTDEARTRLFTPYFTTKPKGTGLGLAIVHRIVTDHGGEIRVSSPPGRGATFTISLPTPPKASMKVSGPGLP